MRLMDGRTDVVAKHVVDGGRGEKRAGNFTRATSDKSKQYKFPRFSHVTFVDAIISGNGITLL